MRQQQPRKRAARTSAGCGKRDPRLWIGFDLDSTLSKGMEKWRGYEKIGKPIPRMVAICRAFIEAGWRVKVFTARVADVDMEDGYTPEMSAAIIRKWCINNIGHDLEITCVKDRWCEMIFDDRVLEVVKNKGILMREVRFGRIKDKKERILASVGVKTWA